MYYKTLSFEVSASFLLLGIKYTQQHKLRTAYSTNDFRGKWIAIY